MFKKYMERLILLLFTAALLSAPLSVNAATKMEYPAQYLEVLVPDGILMFDRDTNANDPVWLKAGVFNVKDRKEEFQNMGVIKAFFDESTGTLITLNSKSNSATAEKFSFTEMTEAEILEYMQAQIASEDASIQTDVCLYDGGEVPFFRAQILVPTPGSEALEVLYGTLINGSMITYDIFVEGTTEADETLAKTLVSATHFTKVLTRGEYEEIIKASYKKFITVIIGIILSFIALVVIAKLFSNRKKKRINQLSERVALFRKNKNEGKVDVSREPSFINDTVYDAGLVDTYTFYNTWLKSIVTQGIVGVCFVLVIWYLYNNGGSSTVYAIFTAAIGVALLFMRNSYRDRMKEQMNRQYDTHSKKTATMRFFDEYFTVSGLSSVTEFLYIQVRSVKVYNGYIYLYISDNQAVILDGEGFTKGEPEEFVEFVNRARKQQ